MAMFLKKSQIVKQEKNGGWIFLSFLHRFFGRKKVM